MHEVITEEEAQKYSYDFNLSFHVASSHLADCSLFERLEPKHLALCHGYPLFNGEIPELDGRPFPYAWVEVSLMENARIDDYDARDENGEDIWFVIDSAPMNAYERAMVLAKSELPQDGRQSELLRCAGRKLIVCERWKFYAAGNIVPMNVQRYSRIEALSNLLRSSSFGPWENVPERGN